MSDERQYRAAIAASIALEGASNPVVIDEGLDALAIAASIEKYTTERAARCAVIAKEFGKSKGAGWVLEIPGTGALLEALAKDSGLTVFHVPEVPGSLFVSTEAVGERASVIVSKGQIGHRQPPTSPLPTALAKAKQVHLVKSDEERFVFGVVLVPETKDSQGDVYSHDEVRKAAHGYMETAGALGRQHSEIITGKLKILESYVAPADFEMDSEKIAKGTWLLGIRVVDDGLWDSVKKGSFTGFSIGGEAYRTPEVSQTPPAV